MNNTKGSLFLAMKRAMDRLAFGKLFFFGFHMGAAVCQK